MALKLHRKPGEALLFSDGQAITRLLFRCVDWKQHTASLTYVSGGKAQTMEQAFETPFQLKLGDKFVSVVVAAHHHSDAALILSAPREVVILKEEMLSERQPMAAAS